MNRDLNRKEKKPKVPVKWQELIEVPPVFTPNDLQVKEEGDSILIRAYREQGTEETGLIKHELVRRVKIPEDVNKESLKTLWLSRSHSMVIVGKKKVSDEKDEESEESKTETEHVEERGTDLGDQHPLTFLLEHFGYPGFSTCDCQKKENQQQPEEPQRNVPIKKAGEKASEKSAAPTKSDQEQVKPGDMDSEPSEAPKVASEAGATYHQNTEEADDDAPPEFEVKPYKMSIDISGYEKDDIQVTHRGHKVTIRGEHREAGAEYSFVKSVTLPDFVDNEHVKWHIDDDGEFLIVTAPMIG
jgi:HSP20 family molecular chaperone IbpA